MNNSLSRLFRINQKLSEKQKTYLINQIKTVELPVGERWVKHGTGAGVAYVQNGLIKMMSRGHDREMLLRFIRDGEGLLLPAVTLKIWFVAIEPTTIHYIEDEDMEEMCERYPQLNGLPRRFTMREVSTRVMDQQIGTFTDQGKLYHLFARHHKHFLDRIPPEDIATYLGISKTVLKMVSSMDGLKRL